MSTFPLANGTEQTFFDYYKQKYDINIKDKQQPLLVNKPREKTSHESTVSRLICLVPEICNLTGLTDVSVFNLKIKIQW